MAQAVVAPEAAGRPLVVGVGASAGGLEAVQAFLRGLPPGSGLAVVVVFHLDPAAKSLLPEVLARHSPLPVVEVTDGLAVEPDHIYTAPPHSAVSVRDGTFRLTPLDPSPARRTPIDHLLQSLADDRWVRAAAVILSGAGSDGTLGLKAVGDSGGVTLVQDPATAKHDGMPQSALATGAADHVLPPEGLAAELLAYASHLRESAEPAAEVDLARQVEQALPAVCDILLQARGHNFRHYKTSTLVRRVRRRLQVLRVGSVRRYVERLRADGAEAEQLFNDLLINVTAFFRDPEAFALLAEEVLPKLFDGRTPDQPVRIWCAGCATGEEAYTLAMLVREHLDTLPEPRPEVQIFATDIDEQALAFARQGAYPVGIADEVGAERLKRFFVKRGQQYHVAKELRELVLFSVHNLINDPPFSRLDLIICRNLLIYLGSHLQKKLIPLFHYALRPGGFLFLGPSESLSTHRELFRPVDAKHRISQRLPSVIRTPGLLPGRSNPLAPARPPNVAPTADPDTYLLMQRIVLDEFAPKAVVVNEDGQIVSASGNLEKYLTVTAGAFHNSVQRLAREGLRVGVRATLAEAIKVRRKVVNDGLALRTDAGVQRVMLTVQPMPQMGEDSGLFLVVFQDVGLPLTADAPEPPPPTGDGSALVEQLERELATTRDDLERTVQDLEVANEELKSGNEELLSMNEELQSANEELETSKEEVQAANDALVRVNTDLENLLASTRIATLFLDRQGHLRWVTPAAAAVYRVRPDDVGRPLADFTHRAKAMPPLPPFDAVREAAAPVEHEVELEDGSHLLRRVLPYRNRDGQAEGVVVTFTDITERKRATEDQARLAAIVESSDDAIVSKTLDGVIRSWNSGAERIFGYTAAEAVGRPITLIIPPDRLDEERGIIDRLRRGQRIEHFETVRVTKGGRRLDISLTVSPLRDATGRVVGASKVARDVTERKRTEAALRALEDRAEFVRQASGVGFWFCDLPFDVLEWDERVKEHFWLPADARVTIDTFYARLHPDDREPTRRAIERSITDRGGYDVYYRTVHPDTGAVKWIRAIGRTAYATDGTPVRFDGVTLDVTDLKRAEEARRESETRYRTLFESMDEGFCVIEFFDGPHGPLSDYVHVEANPAYTANAGIPDIVGRKVREMVPDEAEAWVEIYRNVLLTGRPVRFERELVATGRHLELAAFRVEPPERRQVAVLFKDVTARRRADEALRDETRVVETLNAIGTRLAGELNLQRLLQMVTDETTGLTGAAFGAFFYNGTDERGDAYLLYTLAGAPREAFSKLPNPRATPIFAPTFQGVGTIRLDDVTADPRYGQNPPYRGMPESHLPVRSYLAVPVKSRSGEVLGGLFLGHPQVGAFTARHERLAEGVAAQAAVAIDNARLYDSLRDQDRRKDEFLATLAHELRNPLAPIRTALSVLRMGDTTAERTAPLVGMMDRQLSQMIHLVDDLLDVSRVTTGKVVLKVERLDLRQVIDATLEACRPPLEAAGHTLTVRLPDGPLPLDGDPTRLVQVFTNVLTNAGKYTPPGGHITLAAEREPGWLVVRVADTGMGIPADMLPRVFEMFTQVGRHLDRAQGGLGIGLSLVKRLAEMHGGTVTAESPGPGKGSTFTVRLPAAAAPRVFPPSADGAARPAAAAVTRRVLVVDDNRDAADSLAMLLGLKGHDTRTAHDGPAAVDEGRRFDPQVVFLDIGLPGMSGYDVARAFRADPRLAGAVLVALTGWGSEQDKRRSREAGFDHHLTKPVDAAAVDELLARLPA